MHIVGERLFILREVETIEFVRLKEHIEDQYFYKNYES
jgi:hypothetical protein